MELISITKGKLLLILLLSSTLFFCFLPLVKKNINIYRLFIDRNKEKKIRKNDLDGCHYVYIDMGTNIGIQIRKLYQPYLYPHASVLPIFKEVFGNSSKDVCSVGFEANPIHTNYLKEFEEFCREQKWRVKIYTSIAVSIEESNKTFYIEPNNNINNQWGSSLYQGIHTNQITIKTINIISYIQNIVLQRYIPLSSPTPKILIKSDIEGHDSIVLAHLILQGIFCSIDFIYGEHFNQQFHKSISLLQTYSKSCPTKLIYLDDETYHDQRFPFLINYSNNNQ